MMPNGLIRYVVEARAAGAFHFLATDAAAVPNETGSFLCAANGPPPVRALG
jgi:hypothetical protein